MVGGCRRRRLVPRGSGQRQRRAHDAGDEGAIGSASGAGLDTLQTRQAWLPVQVDAEKVFAPFAPLQHHGGHRSPEQAPQLRGGI